MALIEFLNFSSSRSILNLVFVQLKSFSFYHTFAFTYNEKGEEKEDDETMQMHDNDELRTHSPFLFRKENVIDDNARCSRSNND